MVDYRELKRLHSEAIQLSDAAREPFLAALAPDVRAALVAYLADDGNADEEFLAPLKGNLKECLQAHITVGNAVADELQTVGHVREDLPTNPPRAVDVPLVSPVDVMTPSCQSDETLVPAARTDAPSDSSANFLKDLLAPPDRAGDLGRFGEYRVQRVLGAGGMGVVLQAEDPQLRRPVAIKLMRPEVACQPRAKERFLREAQAAAAVADPRIVIIHHVDEVNGVPFLVMPLMAGQSLASRLRQGPDLPLPEAVRIARETAEGLGAAHARGLTHRDLKPDNIWLEETREGTHVRILDFGLARCSDHEPLTQPGAVLGTPAYMAPEQAAGRAVDSRADLFSLGCVLYEMTTRQRPFVGASVFAVLSALANDTPPAPCTLNASVPPALSDLILCLLAKSPDARPASAVEIVKSLHAVEATLAENRTTSSVGVIGPSSAVRMRRPAILVGTLVAAAFAVASIWFLRAAQNPRSGNLEPEPLPPRLSQRPAPAVPAQLRVVSIDVRHFARVGSNDAVERGVIGRQSFAASLGDQVTIEAKLSRPAYAYLLAFRPDGAVELCFPEDEAEAPPLSDRPHYPSKSRNLRYGLSDGTGLTVFAVVSSSDRLPPYREWMSKNKPVWKTAAGSAGQVWWDDGTWLESLTPERVNRGKRSKGEEALGQSGAVIRVTDSLKKTAPTCIVGSIGFAVIDANQPNPK